MVRGSKRSRTPTPNTDLHPHGDPLRSTAPSLSWANGSRPERGTQIVHTESCSIGPLRLRRTALPASHVRAGCANRSADLPSCYDKPTKTNEVDSRVLGRLLVLHIPRVCARLEISGRRNRCGGRCVGGPTGSGWPGCPRRAALSPFGLKRWGPAATSGRRGVIFARYDD